jgi:DHA2 family multidrug resistance protein
MQLAITGFMISSGLCGLSQSMDQMLLLRICQGLSGAALIPLSQSILFEVYPPEGQVKAMAIWGLGIMTAPVMGPTIGGYIVSYSSWRWIFYINLPICMLSLILCHFVIPIGKIKKRNIDFNALIYMVFGIGALQLFLDQGNSKSWFESHFIIICLIIAITGITGFIIRSFNQPKPLVHLHLLSQRNFTISSLLMLIFCGCMFGTLAMQPIMLSSLFGYPTITIGLAMAPRGFASAFGMVLSPMLAKRLQPKWLISMGLLLCAYGTFQMSRWTLETSLIGMIEPSLWQGLGMGLFMVPISTGALSHLPKDKVTEGSGLFSYARMLGTSIGISLLSTLITRQTQIQWHNLSDHITPFSTNLRTWFLHMHLAPNTPKSITQLSQTIYQQASFMAYVNAFFILSIFMTAAVILALSLEPSKNNTTIIGH